MQVGETTGSEAEQYILRQELKRSIDQCNQIRAEWEELPQNMSTCTCDMFWKVGGAQKSSDKPQGEPKGVPKPVILPFKIGKKSTESEKAASTADKIKDIKSQPAEPELYKPKPVLSALQLSRTRETVANNQPVENSPAVRRNLSSYPMPDFTTPPPALLTIPIMPPTMHNSGPAYYTPSVSSQVTEYLPSPLLPNRTAPSHSSFSPPERAAQIPSRPVEVSTQEQGSNEKEGEANDNKKKHRPRGQAVRTLFIRAKIK